MHSKGELIAEGAARESVDGHSCGGRGIAAAWVDDGVAGDLGSGVVQGHGACKARTTAAANAHVVGSARTRVDVAVALAIPAGVSVSVAVAIAVVAVVQAQGPPGD